METKKIYEQPQTEVVELKMEQALLTASNDPLAPRYTPDGDL